MTIDEAMYFIEHHKPNDVNNAYELGEAFCVAIDTMRKYQQIEEIVIQYKKFGNIDFSMQIISGVVEDGNAE